MIVLHNPTEAPVKDYPIQDPETKEVLLWNINPGETLEFPNHVGKYLLEVYGFLQEVMTEEQFKEKKEEEKKKQEGKIFTQVKIVRAEGEVVDGPTPPAPGFTNQVLQPANAKEENLTVNNFPFTCTNPECGQKFRTEKLLRTHIGLRHLELPTS